MTCPPRACDIPRGPHCFYCGATDVVLHRDHVRPRSRGGSDHPDNLVDACVPCNYRKMTLPAWLFVLHEQSGVPIGSRRPYDGPPTEWVLDPAWFARVAVWSRELQAERAREAARLAGSGRAEPHPGGAE